MFWAGHGIKYLLTWTKWDQTRLSLYYWLLLHVQTAFQSEQLLQDTLVLLLLGY